MLENLSMQLIQTKAFQDHQTFEAAQFVDFDQTQPLLMTEKMRSNVCLLRKELVVCPRRGRD